MSVLSKKVFNSTPLSLIRCLVSFCGFFEWDTHIIEQERVPLSLSSDSLFLAQCLGVKHEALNVPGSLTYILGLLCLRDAEPAMKRFETAYLGSPVYTRILISLIQIP